jgi:hypothetical protein
MHERARALTDLKGNLGMAGLMPLNIGYQM